MNCDNSHECLWACLWHGFLAELGAKSSRHVLWSPDISGFLWETVWVHRLGVKVTWQAPWELTVYPGRCHWRGVPHTLSDWWVVSTLRSSSVSAGMHVMSAMAAAHGEWVRQHSCHIFAFLLVSTGNLGALGLPSHLTLWHCHPAGGRWSEMATLSRAVWEIL